MKKCIRCGEQKPLTDYTKNKRTKDNLERRCKPCSNECNKASYEKHKSNRLKKCAEYRESHKDYYQEKVASWWKNNPDYEKEWRKANPGFSTKWYRDNPENEKFKSRGMRRREGLKI